MLKENQRIMKEIKYRLSVGNKENVFNFSSGNNWAHEYTKFRICYYLKKKGIPFFTEARFKENVIPDILVPTFGVVIEVLDSETEQMFEEKERRYKEEIPEIVKVFKIKASSPCEDLEFHINMLLEDMGVV